MKAISSSFPRGDRVGVVLSVAVLMLLVLASVSTVVSQTTGVVSIAAGGRNPQQVVFDSGKGEFFVVDSVTGNVVVVSDSSDSIVANVTTPGKFGAISGLAYDPSNGYVYASFYTGGFGTGFSDWIVGISDASNTIVQNISLGKGESASLPLAFDPGKGEIFVSLSHNNTVGVISASTGKVVANVKVGPAPDGLAYDSGKGEVFVADYGYPYNTVSVISDSSDTVVANVTVGSEPQFITYDSGKGEVFVSGGTILEVASDSSNKVVANITIPNNFHGMAYDPADGYLYAASGGSLLYEVSDQTNAIVGQIALTGTNMVAFDPAKGVLLVTDYYHNMLSIVSDSATFTTTGAPTTASSSSTTSSSSSQSSSSGGVPEFPYQLTLSAVFTILMVASYLVIRLRLPGRRTRASEGSTG